MWRDTNTMDVAKLSKKMAHALRHDPDNYGLVLDSEGWVSLADFLPALKLSADDISNVLSLPGKQRYEVSDNKIRALFGHSQGNEVEKTPAKPPDVLYHGTTISSLELIKKDGFIKPMSRQFVHLTTDPKLARSTAERKKEKVVVLGIFTSSPYTNGAKFYQGNDEVWLSEQIPYCDVIMKSYHKDYDRIEISEIN